MRCASLIGVLFLLAPLLNAQVVPAAQPTIPEAGPIAIVPIDTKSPDAGANVTGALEVSRGKAIIAASGSVTSGAATTEVVLPHRGVLRVCASTTVNLAADASAPSGQTPGLMMSMDHGAVEMSFAASAGAGHNADILLTPDFRILIGAPGAAEVKVRLGQHGDTCVDNAGANAPYVLVTSVFDGGNYRVQAGQRVMFEHGSLREVVDNEKEPCGCPPAAPKGNEFPLAQSEGLAPLAKPAPSAADQNGVAAPMEPLVYKSADHAAQPTGRAVQDDGSAVKTSMTEPVAKKKPGVFSKIGRFFKRVFGAE
jgi:hypothetical protein